MRDVDDISAHASRPTSSAASPGEFSSRGALAATQRQLALARRRIEALLAQESVLKKQLALTIQSVTRARRFAYHDELTKLPNRRLLLDRFTQVMALAERGHKHPALLFIDLDGFKRVNDALGHAMGDQLLKQVSTRMVACLRGSDTLCRIGGDEFVVLLPELEGREWAVVAAEKLRVRIATPYMIGDTTIKIGASIGIAVYPADGNSFNDLLHASDLAMYGDKAKRAAEIPTYESRS